MKALKIFLLITLTIYLVSITKTKTFTWDVYGYSFYLSGLINDNSLLEPKHLDHIDSIYKPCSDVKEYGRFDVPNSNNQVYKYTVGTAYFYAPFYFSAHIYTKYIDSRGKYPADGYSSPYHKSILIAWLFYSLLGLYVLGKFLLRYFSTISVIACLCIIAFTTNYWAYSINILGYNHIPLFLLAGCILLFSDNWARFGKARDFYLLCICIGLSIVVRPSEITLFLLIPAILVLTKKYQKALVPFLKTRIYQLFVGGSLAFVVVLPQLVYWYMATGSFLPSAYQGESFDFTDSEIIKGLFSYKKGWLVYSPLMVLSIIGLIPFYKAQKLLASSLSLYLFLNIFVIFSWWSWWYGGSLGARSMIQNMAFWAIPLCFLLNSIESSLKQIQKKWQLLAYAIMISIVVFFGVVQYVQMRLYNGGILHWENMNKESYWSLFLNLNPSDELVKKLHNEEYNK